MHPEALPSGRGARMTSVLFCAHFALVGALSPYFGLYLEAWGLGIAQIGVLLAVPQVVRLFAPSLWGAWADRLGARGRMLRVSAMGVLIAMLLMLAARGHYGSLLVCLALLHFFMAAQAPIAESIALGLARGDAGAYGRMRQWGSIGFIAAGRCSMPSAHAGSVCRSCVWLPGCSRPHGGRRQWLTRGGPPRPAHRPHRSGQGCESPGSRCSSPRAP
jgi:MFS family permease